jgi:hypothetical protein
VVGTPEAQRQELQTWPFVPVKVIARYGLTRARLGELRDLLDRIVNTYDEQMGGAQG